MSKLKLKDYGVQILLGTKINEGVSYKLAPKLKNKSSIPVERKLKRGSTRLKSEFYPPSQEIKKQIEVIYKT